MADKPAARNTQATDDFSEVLATGLENRLDRPIIVGGRRSMKTSLNNGFALERFNVYVDGKFRAQLNHIAANDLAQREMRKGGSVFVTRKQWDVSEYMA